MTMLLIVNEKPSQARNFAKALGGRSGSYDGRDYEIVALRGHIMGLDKSDGLAHQVPDARRERYASWDPEALPWDAADFSWAKVVTADDVMEELESALGRADGVCIATDVDPSGEGELLAWEALAHAGWNGPTWRMRFEDEAVPSIRRAFEDMHRIAMISDGDFAKAQARERWDFLSMQFTRAATAAARTRGYRETIRQGRLKSVMVSLIGAQLDAVAAYRKQPFYEARFRDAAGNVYKRADSEGHRFATPEEAQGEVGALADSAVSIDSDEQKTQAPPKLPDLAALSAELAKKGLAPAVVLATYQKMYEDQLVSYPRTEDKKVTPEQFSELLPKANAIAELVGVDPALLTHLEPRPTHVAAGGAHGANRPGPRVPESLEGLDAAYGAGAADIYRALAQSYLAMLCDDYRYRRVAAHVADYPEFATVANVPVSPGFKAVLGNGTGEEQDGEENSGEPEGPAVPFAFEGANKKPPAPTMKWLMKKLEKYDVGTGATRTSTLADVSAAGDKRALVSNSRGKLDLTEIGRASYILLNGCQIASPEVTERLFDEMRKVGRYEVSEAEVLATVAPMVVHDRDIMLANAAKLPAPAGSALAVVGKCPKCGADAVLKPKSVQCSTNRFEKSPDGTWHSKAGSCGWMANRTVAHKLLTQKQVEALLAGKQPKVSGLISKSGKRFEARLALNEDGRIEFRFDDKPKGKGRRK